MGSDPSRIKRNPVTGQILRSAGQIKRCTCCTGECACGEPPCETDLNDEYVYEWTDGVTTNLMLRSADCCCDPDEAVETINVRSTFIQDGTGDVVVDIISGSGNPTAGFTVHVERYVNGVLDDEFDDDAPFSSACMPPEIGYGNNISIGRGSGLLVRTCRHSHGWAIFHQDLAHGETPGWVHWAWDVSLVTADGCLNECWACCHPDDFCFQTDLSGCDAVGGTFHDGLYCDDPTVPCPDLDTGACCFQEECTQTNQTDCEGDFYGYGVPCVGVVCPNAEWACCEPGDPPECVNRTQSACDGVSGTWYPFETCAEVDCEEPQTGACCDPNQLTCTQETVEDCLAAGGEHHGEGTICSGDDPCRGACCYDTVHGRTCTMETATQCATLTNSAFYGYNINCGQINCSLGDGAGGFL